MGLNPIETFAIPKRGEIIDPMCYSAENFFLDYFKACRELSFPLNIRRMRVRTWKGNEIHSVQAIQKGSIPDCDINFGRPTYLITTPPFEGVLAADSNGWIYDLLKLYYNKATPQRLSWAGLLSKFTNPQIVTVRAIRNLNIGIADYSSLPPGFSKKETVQFPEAFIANLRSFGVQFNEENLINNIASFDNFARNNRITISR